jgi:long-chain acyl-CoA synthetase
MGKIGAETLRTLFDRFERHESKPALLSFAKKGVDEITYRQLSETVKDTAVRMIAAGLKKGERAIFFAPNSPSWIISALSVIYSGATLVPVDSQQSDDVLNHIIEDSGAAWIFTNERGNARLEKLRGASGNRCQLRTVILDKTDVPESWASLGKSGSDPKNSSTASDPASPPLEDSDIAVIFYTSGTTGMPKGVPLSHANMLLQIRSIADAKFLNASDRVLLPLPLFHVYPLNIGLLVPLSMGLPVIL